METLIDLINTICQWSQTMVAGITVPAGQDFTLLTIMNHHFPKAYNDLVGLLGSQGWLASLTSIVGNIGLLLLLIYYSVDLMSKASSIGFSLESFIFSLVKLVAGFVLISYMDDLCEYIIKFGDYVALAISQGQSTTIDYGFNSAMQTLAYLQSDELKLTQMQIINLSIKCLMQVALTAVLNITAIVLSYNRAIKLCLYKVFMPIMVADVFGSGVSGAMLKHVKKYLGIVMEYPICCIIAVLATVIIKAVPLTEGNVLAYMGQLVMIIYAVFKVTKSVSSEAEEIFGSR